MHVQIQMLGSREGKRIDPSACQNEKKKKEAIDPTDGGHEATNDVERKNPFRRRVLLVIQLPTRGGLILLLLLPGIVCLRAVGGFSLSLSSFLCLRVAQVFYQD